MPEISLPTKITQDEILANVSTIKTTLDEKPSGTDFLNRTPFVHHSTFQQLESATRTILSIDGAGLLHSISFAENIQYLSLDLILDGVPVIGGAKIVENNINLVPMIAFLSFRNSLVIRTKNTHTSTSVRYTTMITYSLD